MKTKLIKTASGMEVEQDGKSYPVRSEDEEGFKELVYDILNKEHEHIILMSWVDKALSQGIEILSERVEIVKPDENSITMFEPFATLLTEDKEGEGQGDLWDELFDHIENTPVDVPWADCIKELKQKFKITKK